MGLIFFVTALMAHDAGIVARLDLLAAVISAVGTLTVCDWPRWGKNSARRTRAESVGEASMLMPYRRRHYPQRPLPHSIGDLSIVGIDDLVSPLHAKRNCLNT